MRPMGTNSKFAACAGSLSYNSAGFALALVLRAQFADTFCPQEVPTGILG